MNNTAINPKVKSKPRRVPAWTRNINCPSWPLYTGGKEPSVEEFADSIKSMSYSDMKRVLVNAGIIDEEGNYTEIYKP